MAAGDRRGARGALRCGMKRDGGACRRASGEGQVVQCMRGNGVWSGTNKAGSRGVGPFRQDVVVWDCSVRIMWCGTIQSGSCGAGPFRQDHVVWDCSGRIMWRGTTQAGRADVGPLRLGVRMWGQWARGV
eukprot:357921-Chlamydomonas_euryale.AAC.5